MPITKYIQCNFTSGVFSKKMRGRVDLARYYNAVDTLQNWMPLVQGGVTRRNGFHFVDYPKYPLPDTTDKKCRLIPFEYGITQAYVIEVGYLYMRFIKDGALVRLESGSDLVTNGDFAAGIGGWTDYSVAPGTAAWDGVGAATLDGGATGEGALGQQLAATTNTKTYLLKFDVITDDVHLRIGTTAEGTDILNDVLVEPGLQRQTTFIARGANTYIEFLRKSNGSVKIDNVACKLYDPVEIVSPYADTELDDLKWAQDSNDLYITHPSYWPRRVTRTSDTAWTITTIDNEYFKDGPYFAEQKTPTITPTWIGPSVEKVINGGFDADATWTKGANWTIAGGVASKSAGAANNLSQDTTEVAAQIYRVIWTLVSVSGGSITMSIGGTSGAAQNTAGTYTEFITAAGGGDLTFTPSAAGVVCSIDNVSALRLTTLTASVSLWVADQVGALWRLGRYHGDGFGNFTWWWGCAHIVQVTDATHVNAVVLTDWPFYDLTATDAQREGRWSTLQGFPRSVAFHEGRLTFGGSPTSPQTFCGSVTDDPYNMSPTSNDGKIIDSNAISFTIGSTKVNLIRWLISAKGLLLGTNGGLFACTASPITPTSVELVNEATERASAIQGLRVGPSILFVENAGVQVLEATYNYTSESLETQDLSVLADDLVSNGIVDMVHQAGPNPALWFVKNNGDLLALVYRRNEKIASWSEQITDGDVESLAVIPNSTGAWDDVYAVINRTINTVPTRTIEYLDPYLNVDCGLSASFTVAVSTLSGLEHLAGEIVDIVGDDAVYPVALVDANGQIEIDPPAKDIEVGLHYDAYLKTLKPEIKSDQNTIQPCKKRWTDLYVKVVDTVGLTLNGEVIPFRSSLDPMGDPITPFTGDKQIFNLGWEDDGVVVIEQKLPLSSTVLSIFGTLEIN